MSFPFVFTTERVNFLSMFIFFGVLNLNSTSSLHPEVAIQINKIIVENLQGIYVILNINNLDKQINQFICLKSKKYS